MSLYDEGFLLPPEIGTSSSSNSDESYDEALHYLNLCVNVIEEEEEGEVSAPKRRRRIYRDRENGHQRLMELYFVENPRYPEEIFKLRFRMSKRLFLKIVDDVTNDNPWFTERIDAKSRRSFTPLQKCTVAIRQLAYGNVPDEYDESLDFSERTARECLNYFCESIIKLYRDEFLRSPTSHDITLLYNAHLGYHGLPGMIGSIDCTHWEWRNCPRKYRAQYHRGDHKKPTISLEAVASQDLWFWHAFFGVAGANNDINVLNQSPLFKNELHGVAPRMPFVCNGRQYKRGYYLTDGIYPPWSVFLKAFPHPFEIKEKKMKKIQEGARKDVERAFGRLKEKWKIVEREGRPLKKELMINIMYAVIILSNMVLKDDGLAISPVHIRDPPVDRVIDPSVIFELRDSETHFKLRHDITEHIENTMEVILTEAELNANAPDAPP